MNNFFPLASLTHRMESLIKLNNNNNRYNTIQQTEKSPLNGNQQNNPQYFFSYLSAKRSTVELVKEIHQELVDAAQSQQPHNFLLIL